MTIPILERIAPVQKLWASVLPTIPVPDVPQLAKWVERYNESAITHAVVRAATKLRKGGLVPTSSEATRYIGGVLRNQPEAERARLQRAIDYETKRGAR
jgi:hypothetical protein